MIDMCPQCSISLILAVYLLTKYCSPLPSFDTLACDPDRYTFPRITVFVSRDCMIYGILQLDIDCDTECSRTMMSKIQLYTDFAEQGQFGA